MNKKIFIASDHAGYDMKVKLNNHFSSLIDLGTNSTESVDYPDFAHKLTCEILQNEGSLGILICGTGIGMSMAANKHKNIRAALCYNIKTTKLSREHNDANVMAIGARTTKKNIALKCVNTFLKTDFDGGLRHLRRIKKI